MGRAIGSTLQPDQDTAAGLGQETSLLNSGTLPSGAFHEPPLSRPSATLSPPCGERAGRGVPIWFMVPMRAQKRKEAFHEPDFGRDLTLVGTSRCDVPAREAAGGIIAPLSAARTAQRAVPTGSGSKARKFRGILSMNRAGCAFHEPSLRPRPRLADSFFEDDDEDDPVHGPNARL